MRDILVVEEAKCYEIPARMLKPIGLVDLPFLVSALALKDSTLLDRHLAPVNPHKSDLELTLRMIEARLCGRLDGILGELDAAEKRELVEKLQHYLMFESEGLQVHLKEIIVGFFGFPENLLKARQDGQLDRELGRLSEAEKHSLTLDNIFCAKDQAALEASLLPNTGFTFEKHIGQRSDYPVKQDLENSLRLVDARLTGRLDHVLGELASGEATAILEKVREGIEDCSEGYHNRINALVQGCAPPAHTIPELLFKVRQWIVERVARSRPEGVGVHAHNQVYIIASSLYGVVAPNIQDRYVSEGRADRIFVDLESEFSKSYQLVFLPDILIATIRDRLSNLGYCGEKKDEKGYDLKEYTDFLEYLKLICAVGFGMEVFIKDDIGRIVDIDWPQVQAALFQKLQQEGYYRLEQVSSSLEKPREFINYLLMLRKYNSSDFQILFETLSQSDWVKLLWQAWSVIMHAIIVLPELGEVLFEKVNQFTRSEKIKFLNKKDAQENHILSFIIQHQPDLLQVVMELVPLDYRLRFSLLKQKNKQGYNSITIAVRYQPKILEELLLSCTPSDQVFLLRQENAFGESCLLLAIMYQPTALPILFKYLPPSLIVEMLGRCHEGKQCLEIAAYQYPAALPYLVEKILDLRVRENVLLYLFGYSLHFALEHQADALPEVLKLFDKFSPESRVKLLKQLNFPNQVNCLMVAAKWRPAYIPTMLKEMKKAGCSLKDKVEIISQTIVGINCLMLSAHSLEAISILNAIQDFSEQYIYEILSQRGLIALNSTVSYYNFILLVLSIKDKLEVLSCLLDIMAAKLSPGHCLNILDQQDGYGRNSVTRAVVVSQFELWITFDL